jgi:hypothetical protein
MDRFALLLAAVACICIQSVAARDCYECTPKPGDDCSDSSTAVVKTCEGEDAYCRY